MRLKKLNPLRRTGVPLAHVGPEKMSGRRRKLSARIAVHDLIKEIDPASFGPPVQTAAVPELFLKLNDEYKDLFPSALPLRLNHSRHTDHNIDFQQKYKVTAPRRYRLDASYDAKLQKQLMDLNAHGYIKPVTSPF